MVIAVCALTAILALVFVGVHLYYQGYAAATAKWQQEMFDQHKQLTGWYVAQGVKTKNPPPGPPHWI